MTTKGVTTKNVKTIETTNALSLSRSILALMVVILSSVIPLAARRAIHQLAPVKAMEIAR